MSEVDPIREKKTRSGPSSGSFKIARVEVQQLAALAGPEVAGTPGTDLLSDELLVDRILAGESEHYDVLIRRSAARLYRLARGIVGDELRAEEVVQLALVQGYENLASCDRKLRMSDWLSRIAIFGSLASLRRQAHAPRSAAPDRPELVRQLENAVDGLPEDFRVPFTLCVLDGMEPAEAAQVLGVSVGRLQVAAFRGRLRVRRLLGTRFDDVESRAFGWDLGRSEQVLRRVHAELGLPFGGDAGAPRHQR